MTLGVTDAKAMELREKAELADELTDDVARLQAENFALRQLLWELFEEHPDVAADLIDAEDGGGSD